MATNKVSRRPFAGTAEYYLKFRVPYPNRLLADLRHRVSVADGGVLLDLASGPGRVALPMAPFFQSVIAVDIEPEMIAAGEKEAMTRGIVNVRWIVSRVEELDIEPGSIDLTTIGEAFHRLNQPLIVQHVIRWLRARGCLATLGATHEIWNGSQEWQLVLAKFVEKWARGASVAPHGIAHSTKDERDQVLRNAGFELESYEFAAEHVWDLDSILGYLFSTSILSRPSLGGDVDRFEEELRGELLSVDPSGSYSHTLTFGYTLARHLGDSDAG